jgi:hypothetical protein
MRLNEGYRKPPSSPFNRIGGWQVQHHSMKRRHPYQTIEKAAERRRSRPTPFPHYETRRRCPSTALKPSTTVASEPNDWWDKNDICWGQVRCTSGTSCVDKAQSSCLSLKYACKILLGFFKALSHFRPPELAALLVTSTIYHSHMFPFSIMRTYCQKPLSAEAPAFPG